MTTISEIIDIKGISIEDLCRDAKSKGMALPYDLKYEMSPSQIKSLYPELAFNLKYGRFEKANDGFTKEDSAHSTQSDILQNIEDDRTCSKVMIDSSIQGHSSKRNSIKEENNNNKKIKMSKRIIGIVKFFDSNKGWGFVVGNKCISKRPEDKGVLISIYLNKTEWKGSILPKKRQWVILTLHKTSVGWKAVNAEPIEYNHDTLLWAMKYRGKDAKIHGTNKEESFNENILCNIINNITGKYITWDNGKHYNYDTNKFSEIIDTFCEYISKSPIEQQKVTIKQFLSDDELNTLLFKVFTEGCYHTEDSTRLSAYILYKNALINDIFERGNMSDLSMFPKAFDFTLFLEQLSAFLIHEAHYNSAAVEKWLKSHDVAEKLVLKITDVNTIPLRIILYKLTKEKSWIDSLEADWNAVRTFLKGNRALAYLFCATFFTGKSKEFIEHHKIVDLLDDETIIKWSEKLILCEGISSEFLRILMEQKIEGNLKTWENYVRRGFDITPSFTALRLALSIEIKRNAKDVRAFFEVCKENNICITDIFVNAEGLSDEMYIELFVMTGDNEYFNKMEDFETTISWLSSQPAKFVLTFILRYGQLLLNTGTLETDSYLKEIGDDIVVNALKAATEEEQYKALGFFPKSYANNIVSEYFYDSMLFDRFVGEQWKGMRSQTPYMVFDIESDGDKIKEFAYLADGNIHYNKDEKQLEALTNEINSKQIIVGHRIKQWDLNILKRHTKISPIFVWDTLEIEILLNPCRYAYSLHTKHNAKDDTELTDRLFWNQLFRLAMDEDLCGQLSEFLPPNITNLLSQLRQPYFVKFYKRSGVSEDDFYQNLHDIDDSMIKSLKTIGENDEKALIIAPQRFWNRIAEHIPVSFIRENNSIDYLLISEKKLKERPLQDSFLQTVLIRFCQMAKTPIVSNLASYLRIQYFNDNTLIDYVTDSMADVQCTNLNTIDSINCNNNFHKVFFIGCELEDKLNQYILSTTYRPADFWQEMSFIPMRLGSSNYTSITSNDRKSPLFNDVPKNAASVWIERAKDGKYLVEYCIDKYEELKKRYYESHSIEVNEIFWTAENENNQSVSLVRSGKGKKFDFLQKRVNSTSRYRSMYWMYQLALLNDIHSSEYNLPIIYILEDDLELEQVVAYAQQLGFYIPHDGTLITKLEKIAQNANGLLIIPKKRFFEITEKRLDTPYCYVWDQMAVEKHMMMWHNYRKKGKVKEKTKATYQEILSEIWHIYQYYSRFILANNNASKMYIIDSFLEEYYTLCKVWDTKTFVSDQLWNSEESFGKQLIEAKKIFGEYSIKEDPQKEFAIKTAMDVILSTMIPERGGKRQWSDIQKEVLPEILCKKENYLVSIPTGGGKSVLFQGPALYNASHTNRLSLVVTPLKALMKDQVEELFQKGFYTNVDYLNGDRTYQEVRSVYRKINSGEIALLYVTPERFRSRAFLNALSTRMMHDNGLEYMIFDEAHCISQWGMEFRPEYLNVIKKCKEFTETYSHGICMVMFSATVTDMIYNQINKEVPIKRLGQNNDKENYNPIRSHIRTSFQLISHDTDSRINAIISYIKEKHIDFQKSRMLIFCKTHKQCERLAASLPPLLVDNKIFPQKDSTELVSYFHGGMNTEDRDDTYKRFKSDDDPIYILCATKAFGMGMDIPNIHYIIHLSPPNVLEDYLQEVGRAGRDKELYIQAGFNENNPIPTVCLYSTEDIKKSREQLLQNTLSWKNIEEIRTSICNYISNIQSLEKTKKNPIVIPYNLWASSQTDYEYTNFKIGEYWLERMGRIKMGYISPAHITITIKQKDITDCILFSSKEGAVTKKIYEYLQNISKQKGNNTIQVSLHEMAGNLSIHSTKVLNELISCAKYKLLEIEQEVRCRIANTRSDEVPYLLKHPDVELAFHAIINATEKLLADNKPNKEKTYSEESIRKLIDMSSTNNILKKADGKYYMPWYNKEEKEKNQGLTIAKNYKKDLMEKRFRQIFSTLLDIIPDVKCKSYIDEENCCVKQSILVTSDTWKDFLPEFKKNCLKTLKYIFKLQQQNEQKFNWAKTLTSLGLDEKGFSYFESILRYLFGMAYIATDNLLPTGIEVYTTEFSERPILEEIKPENKDFEEKKAFDEAALIRNLRLCVMDVATSKIKSSDDFQKLISAYFSKTDANGFIELLSKYYEDNDPIWEVIREKVIEDEENKMKSNSEQWAIYNESPNGNVNVEAGPGSGKTHVLTMKCAKLIYRQHVIPKQILVLAYNRAVVVELKSRLNKLFTSLGLSRSASQLHVYTFHGLAKKVCGNTLNSIAMNDWETELLKLLKNTPIEFTKILGEIKYVFIDEFQDITQTRLDAIFELDKIYHHPAFFTIGDRNQSIYGFEKKESMDPKFYYDQLYKELKPKRMTMTTNYRSYPQILEKASTFLDDKSNIPNPCKAKIKERPTDKYAFIFDIKRKWSDDFLRLMSYFRKQHMKDVAVFFRTNSEVYNGYALIKALNVPNVRIRIQGASECELYRKREIYSVIRIIEKQGNQQLLLENDKTRNWIKEKIIEMIGKHPQWDSFYLDFAYTLILDYLETAKCDEESHTYLDMAEAIKSSLSEDNPQLYKLYDKYEKQRILQNEQMNVVLTTMHKVKGLEFDAVIITPSVASLPFDPQNKTNVNLPLTSHDKECIEEEQRLLYVAYTRARKFLAAYEGPREKAIRNKCKYEGDEASLGIREQNPGLDNYNIGFNASYNYKYQDFIENLEKNAPVIIEKKSINKNGQIFDVFNIQCGGTCVGQLSSSSTIANEMRNKKHGSLKGFFVSDIFYWTFQDTCLADQRKGTNYASRWCEAAKNAGFILVVSISGFGK